jgi:hypothetical protein
MPEVASPYLTPGDPRHALVVGSGADRAQTRPAPAAASVAPVNPYWVYTEDVALDTAPCAASPAACGR